MGLGPMCTANCYCPINSNPFVMSWLGKKEPMLDNILHVEEYNISNLTVPHVLF